MLPQLQEKIVELEASLQSARESEASLAVLVTSSGNSALRLGGLDWSTADAQVLLREETQKLENVEEMLARLRQKRFQAQHMIAEQHALASKLAALDKFAPPTMIAAI